MVSIETGLEVNQLHAELVLCETGFLSNSETGSLKNWFHIDTCYSETCLPLNRHSVDMLHRESSFTGRRDNWSNRRS